MNEFKKFDLVGENEDEAERLEDVARAKLRGKGAPKKKKTAEGKSKKSPRGRRLRNYEILIIIVFFTESRFNKRKK